MRFSAPKTLSLATMKLDHFPVALFLHLFRNLFVEFSLHSFCGFLFSSFLHYRYLTFEEVIANEQPTALASGRLQV
jgi:hypothetical protein